MSSLQTASPPHAPPLLTRRNFLKGSAIAAAGVTLYSNEHGRHAIETTFRTFYLPELPPAFDGFRLVQFSDIHLEEYTEDFFLRRVIQKVNALNPDLVLITGDFISNGPKPLHVSLEASARCAELLGTLTCPQRYGVLGNHDVLVGPSVIRNHLEHHGLPLLVNQHVRIERGNEHIFLGGIDNYSWGTPNLSLAVPEQPDAPVLLMAHEPDFANTVLTHPSGQHVDFIFSGHTHGGQIRIPGLRPLALPPNGKLYPEGHYLLGKMQLYVNRGIGTVGLPLRFNCPPEITVATLRPANLRPATPHPSPSPTTQS